MKHKKHKKYNNDRIYNTLQNANKVFFKIIALVRKLLEIFIEEDSI